MTDKKIIGIFCSLFFVGLFFIYPLIIILIDRNKPTYTTHKGIVSGINTSEFEVSSNGKIIRGTLKKQDCDSMKYDPVIKLSNGNDIIDAVGDFILKIDIKSDSGTVVILPQWETVFIPQLRRTGYNMKYFKCEKLEIDGDVRYSGGFETISDVGITYIDWIKDDDIILVNVRWGKY